MKSRIAKLSEKTFLRNVIIMVTGTAAAQIVNMALSPIITRLYGPVEFGLLGVFASVIGIVSPIAALTYPIAIVLPKSDNEAKKIVNLSLYISVCIASVIAIILTLFNQSIARLFNLEEIASFLYLIPLVILFSGLLNVTEQWLIRTKQFKTTARVTFFQALISQGSKVGIGFFYPVASVLIIITILSTLTKALMMIFFANNLFYKKGQDAILNNETVSYKKLAKKYKDFPLYRAPEVLLNAVSQSLPILILTSFFGPASAGFYSIGRTVLAIPSQLIGKSVGDVFYPRIAEAAINGENLTRLIKKATLALAAVGILPYGIVVAFGPWLFGFVFGSEWVMAGEYARWIALWVFFMFINQPSVKALPVMSAQSFHLKFTSFSLIVRISVLAIGYYGYFNDLIAIALFGISGAVLNICLILLTVKRSRKFYN
jgi:O-antigen/teichoic acid export membrane protein